MINFEHIHNAKSTISSLGGRLQFLAEQASAFDWLAFAELALGLKLTYKFALVLADLVCKSSNLKYSLFGGSWTIFLNLLQVNI
jgi:hypothetical protein